ncbi:MAG: pseudouridine synthase [Rhodobacteraceae bacterium MED-G07]|nr:MAG: pseudouridine synthase [Rhodobacteraceae bacterium MED-G07]
MEDQANKGERIAKIIARAGLASRRESEKLILDGKVKVNGKTISSPARNLSRDDVVEVDGKLLSPPEKTRIWMYHKPVGLISTSKDEKNRPTIFDKLPNEMPRVLSIGRLDLNSEGLLLLTNDGELKRRLELPSTGWLRSYRVRVKGRLNENMLEPLRRGISVDGTQFKPMQVSFDRQTGANAWLSIGLREGKNREIRKALSLLGLSVNRLIRISFGDFELGKLKKGEIEEVRSSIVKTLFKKEVDNREMKENQKGNFGRKGTKNKDKVSITRNVSKNRRFNH